MDLNFSSLLGAMPGALSQGILWGIMAVGVYVTFKILDFPDLTVDGSFATGGSISAILITHGMNPWLSLVIAFLGGCVCGLITGLLHTKLKIPGILAGILTMIALYSVNIRVMLDASNVPLLGIDTIVSQLRGLLPFLNDITSALIIGVVLAAVIIALLYMLFGTEVGCAIRATGNNEHMVRALGVNTDTMKIAGLVLSNGLVALSGAAVAQSQGYADATMGIGTIVIGLASVIIGEVIMGVRFNFAYKLTSVVVGSIIYRAIIAIVLWLGLKSSDLKLLTALVVALALSVPVLLKKRAYKRPDEPKVPPEMDESDINPVEPVQGA